MLVYVELITFNLNTIQIIILLIVYYDIVSSCPISYY